MMAIEQALDHGRNILIGCRVCCLQIRLYDRVERELIQQNLFDIEQDVVQTDVQLFVLVFVQCLENIAKRQLHFVVFYHFSDISGHTYFFHIGTQLVLIQTQIVVKLVPFFEYVDKSVDEVVYVLRIHVELEAYIKVSDESVHYGHDLVGNFIWLRFHLSEMI